MHTLQAFWLSNHFTNVDSFTQGQVTHLIIYILSNSDLNLVQSQKFKKKKTEKEFVANGKDA